MKPYIVLGVYKNKNKDCSLIGKDLTKITKDFGLVPFKNKEIKRNKKAAWSDYSLHAEVRKTAVRNSEATQAHQDGDTSVSKDEMDFAMVVWSDRNPTEFIVGNKVYQPKPYELVVAKNLSCFHRRPNISGERYFFRQRCSIPEHIDLP